MYLGAVRRSLMTTDYLTHNKYRFVRRNYFFTLHCRVILSLTQIIWLQILQSGAYITCINLGGCGRLKNAIRRTRGSFHEFIHF